MKEMSVFKSEEGKRTILDYYQTLLKQLPYEYTEKRINTTYGETYVFEAGERR